MSSNPLVSVAVITYNHSKFIGECLEGILMQQTDFEFEVVVADDCSSDGTREIVKDFAGKYPERIRTILHNKNVGGAKNAYEHCYPATRGKYIAVCEGDDLWTDPLKLQKQVDFLEKNPEYVLTFHRVNVIDEAGHVVESNLPSEPKYYSKNHLFRVSISTLSTVFRKSFDQVPGDIYKVKSGDTFLFGLLATYGKGADLGFVGASYRKQSGGVYSSLRYVEQVKQSIVTRRVMFGSAAFSWRFKLELVREIMKRKWMFGRLFFRKNELSNSFKIVFA